VQIHKDIHHELGTFLKEKLAHLDHALSLGRVTLEIVDTSDIPEGCNIVGCAMLMF